MSVSIARPAMILHPRFLRTDRNRSRRRTRKTLGLSPDLPTGLVLFGGQGSKVIADIVASLDKSDVDLQLIAICGRNEKLAQSLRSRKVRMPIFVEGFTKQIPYYMHLSDFFIGKPGPGSLSEAVAMQLPVITECNSWTLPQERYNADWIREKEIGLVVRSFRQIEPAVRELLQPATLERFKRNTAGMPNRAVFEIPGILHNILSRCPPG